MNGQQSRGLFGLVDGLPAQATVVVGLLLGLLGATLPSCGAASAARAAAELDRAEQLMAMDLDQLRAQQERERQAAAVQAAATGQTPDPGMAQRHQDAMRAQREQLKMQYGIDKLRREAIEANASARGPQAHLVLDWIGRLLLVLGLLALAFCAEGTRQVVLAAALVVVLLGSLAGIRIDLGLGRGGPAMELRLPDLPRPEAPRER